MKFNDYYKHLIKENSLVDYIQKINQSKIFSKGNGLIEDPEYWAKRGIYTPEDFELMVLRERISDIYNSVYGSKPDWSQLKQMSRKELEEMLEDLKMSRDEYI